MAKHFPLTWSEWSGGVEKAFQFLEEMEELKARGVQPSEEDALMLPVITLMVAKYHRNGRRKERRPAARPRRPRGIIQHAE